MFQGKEGQNYNLNLRGGLEIVEDEDDGGTDSLANNLKKVRVLVVLLDTVSSSDCMHI